MLSSDGEISYRIKCLCNEVFDIYPDAWGTCEFRHDPCGYNDRIQLTDFDLLTMTKAERRMAGR